MHKTLRIACVATLLGAGLLMDSKPAEAQFQLRTRRFALSLGRSPRIQHNYFHNNVRHRQRIPVTPIYHPPSIRYDRGFGGRGRGSGFSGGGFGVPRYVPGHFDAFHGDHIHLNPRYHR